MQSIPVGDVEGHDHGDHDDCEGNQLGDPGGTLGGCAFHGFSETAGTRTGLQPRPRWRYTPQVDRAVRQPDSVLTNTTRATTAPKIPASEHSSHAGKNAPKNSKEGAPARAQPPSPHTNVVTRTDLSDLMTRDA